MKNKLKGTTLIETILYIGILTSILFVVISFMLSTREATMRTERRSDVYSTSEFLTQHLDYVFSKATSINETRSAFNIDNGTLYINMVGGEHYYALSENTLTYNGIPINNKNTLVKKFNIVPVSNKKGVVVGARITLEIVAKRDNRVSREISILYTIR